MKLAVIGSGYVGLVAGACFSDTGNDVTMVDIDPARVDMLREGKLPIYEPGLGEIVRRNAAEGRLTFTSDLPTAAGDAEVVILAVGTPSAPDGTVDMQWMDAAAEQVAGAITGYTVIVTKSTVPVGTHKRVSDIIAARTDVEFDYVSNPEFLKEGAAVGDFMKPDRVILGLSGDRPLQVMRHLYAPFMRRGDRILVMDPASAELTKYACNAMLATRISFMNELSQMCDHFGADVTHIRRGMGTDHRIGPDFLYPSLGYGGSCFPKDVQGMIAMGRSANRPVRVVEAVHLANIEQREAMFDRIKHYFGNRLGDCKIALWGLAFKARTDDVRESPAITIAQRLVGAGASLAVHDPQAMETAKGALGDKQIEYCPHMYDALNDADALVVCTEWQEFRTPDFARMARLMAGNVIFDGRNLYDLEWIANTPFRYYSIGRPAVNPK
ncbi:MAG: UDP-glucose/GDP-mannose dehydrogenase family protein [Phycisphaerae bacterium]|jgi:UDPglucose 6-dehydrogenase|nr:UDP-glucose/GDP-mannose dehydrogenase family protein [Phycisphaerae bacterium]